MSVIVTTAHLHELGYCARGSRRWFARMGLDWGDFVRDGIDAEILLATGDAMALKLVEHVKNPSPARGGGAGDGENGQQ